MSSPELLRRAIDQADMTPRQFADRVLYRDPRTVRRWLRGESPIPKAVRQIIEDYLAKHAARSHIRSPLPKDMP